MRGARDMHPSALSGDDRSHRPGSSSRGTCQASFFSQNRVQRIAPPSQARTLILGVALKFCANNGVILLGARSGNGREPAVT
jgi:hypothetical protein